MNVITINQRGAARLRGGHLWVYRSDIASGKAPAGALVEVHDERGRHLGSALYSSSSQIAIRLLSSESIPEATLLELVRERVAAAVRFRAANARDTDSYRVIFSEADLLPGLIVDRYNDLITMQILTQAFDRNDLRSAVVDSLAEQFPDASLIERVDPRIRELEQLPPRESQILTRPTRKEGAERGTRIPHEADTEPQPSDRGVPRSSPDFGLGREVKIPVLRQKMA